MVVGISNTMDLPERLLPRVESRLNIRRVNFLPYSHADISAIIIDRLGSLDAFAAGDGGLGCALARWHPSPATCDARSRCAGSPRRSPSRVPRFRRAARSRASRRPSRISTSRRRTSCSGLDAAARGARRAGAAQADARVCRALATGRSEVDATRLRDRHRAMHARGGEFPLLQKPEQSG